MKNQEKIILLKIKIEVMQDALKEVNHYIHDNTGQLLSVVRIDLNLYQEENMIVDIQQRIYRANEIIGDAISGLRTMTNGLENFIDNFRVLDRLSNLILRTNRPGFTIEVTGGHYLLASEREIVVYWISKQIIDSFLGYSEGEAIEVQMRYESEKLVFWFRSPNTSSKLSKIENQLFNNEKSDSQNIRKIANIVNATVTSGFTKNSQVEIKIEVSYY